MTAVAVVFAFLLVTGIQGIVSSPAKTDRPAEILRQMNLTEKLSLLGGVYGAYVGNSPAIPRLNIPAINMQDGPQGFRATDTTGGDGTTTAWPSAMSVASSWDIDLMHSWASAMAAEFAAKGANVQLGPGIGIARVPTAGRNFEYLCGEDPILGAKLVQPVVKGIQEQGVIANAKHFINNEIEDQRTEVSANVDERTRFELYYPPFQAAIDAGVLSVMCSYNRVNDIYACEQPETIAHLRENLGFRGWIMSDWGATHSTVASMKAGLDQEMPYSDYYSATALQTALNTSQITLTDIDKRVYNILYGMDKIGLLDHDNSNAKVYGDPAANVTSPAHSALAREIAGKAAVLMKNDGDLLPLKMDALSGCIAVIGNPSNIVAGDGSGHVAAPYTVTLQQGIQEALAAAGKTTVQVLYNDGKDQAAASALAAKCSVAIVNVAVTCGEGADRATLALGNQQDSLVSAIATSNKRTVVILTIPGAVLMPWIQQVSAAISMWLPGQEAGHAMADLLFGQVNPSGRLPVTMPNKDNEIAFTPAQYPGVGSPPEASYSEGLLIGYRWYDSYQVKPVYPFGHGLSYTKFAYDHLQIIQAKSSSFVTIEFSMQNVGSVDGTEIAQLYLSFPKAAGEPIKQLKDFSKAVLKVNAKQTVTMTLTKRDCSIWNSEKHSWQLIEGTFAVLVGASSQDIRLTGTFQV